MVKLYDLVAQDVVVSVCSQGTYRRGFHTQMSVKGELQHLPNTQRYRVIVPEDGDRKISDGDCTFVYFTEDDVYSIAPISHGMLISIRIDTPEDPDHPWGLGE